MVNNWSFPPSFLVGILVLYCLDITNLLYQIVFSKFRHGTVVISPVAQVSDRGEGDSPIHASIFDVLGDGLTLTHIDTSIIALMSCTIGFNLKIHTKNITLENMILTDYVLHFPIALHLKLKQRYMYTRVSLSVQYR